MAWDGKILQFIQLENHKTQSVLPARSSSNVQRVTERGTETVGLAAAHDSRDGAAPPAGVAVHDGRAAVADAVHGVLHVRRAPPRELQPVVHRQALGVHERQVGAVHDHVDVLPLRSGQRRRRDRAGLLEVRAGQQRRQLGDVDRPWRRAAGRDDVADAVLVGQPRRRRRRFGLHDGHRARRLLLPAGASDRGQRPPDQRRDQLERAHHMALLMTLGRRAEQETLQLLLGDVEGEWHHVTGGRDGPVIADGRGGGLDRRRRGRHAGR